MSKPTQYYGEPDGEYRQRVAQWEKDQAATEQEAERSRAHDQIRSDREVHRITEMKTRDAIQQANAEPLAARILSTKDHGANGYPVAVVQHALRRRPGNIQPGEGEVQIPLSNIYEPCTEDEYEGLNGNGLALLPDDVRRHTLHLRRVDRATVRPDTEGYMLWALDVKPGIGWRSPLNWVFVVSDAFAQKKTTDSASHRAVVEGVRPMGPGVGMAVLKLEDGRSVSVSVLLDKAPERGTTGTVGYDPEGNATFTPDTESE